MKKYGKKTWLIPDAYYPSTSSESEANLISHEAICVINTGDTDANIEINLFFENREPLSPFYAQCGAMRTHHIRMDKLVNKDDEPVPMDVPYAILIESDTEIVVQYSRCDTTQPALTLMTTIAYPV